MANPPTLLPNHSPQFILRSPPTRRRVSNCMSDDSESEAYVKRLTSMVRMKLDAIHGELSAEVEQIKANPTGFGNEEQRAAMEVLNIMDNLNDAALYFQDRNPSKAALEILRILQYEISIAFGARMLDDNEKEATQS